MKLTAEHFIKLSFDFLWDSPVYDTDYFPAQIRKEDIIKRSTVYHRRECFRISGDCYKWHIDVTIISTELSYFIDLIERVREGSAEIKWSAMEDINFKRKCNK